MAPQPIARRSGPHAFVVVEGPNGTGKSTVVRDLVARMSAATFHFPPAFVRFREEAALDTEVDPYPRLHYYLAASVHLSTLVERALASGPVVCDRYLAAPVSLFLAEDVLPREEVLATTELIRPRLVQPDLTLLLSTDHHVAVDRVEGRAGGERDGRLTAVERRAQDPTFHRRRADALRAFSEDLGPVVHLDTTHLDPDQSCRRAWDLVRAFLDGVSR